MELLLANGARGDSVDAALIAAVTEYNLEPLAEPFMDMLLKYKADVNYMSGRSICVAATQGNIPILRRLFARNATFESMRMALPYLFISSVSSEGMMSLFQLFVEHLGDDMARPFENPDIPDAPCSWVYGTSLRATES
jgi:hypothetical protein